LDDNEVSLVYLVSYLFPSDLQATNLATNLATKATNLDLVASTTVHQWN
jgi:hypothetical protein